MPNTPRALYKALAYTDEWVESAFLIWYKAGKPSPEKLQTLLPPPLGSVVPSPNTLKALIKEQFVPRALELDTEIAHQLETELIQEKVAMFHRHTEIAVELQNQALEYLRTEGIKDASTAVKALLSAMDLEKQSRGIDKVLADVGNRSDDQLLKELRKIVSESTSVDFLPLEDTQDAPE